MDELLEDDVIRQALDSIGDEMPEEVIYRANKYVATITLNRPEAKNAMNTQINAGLTLSMKRILATPTLRIVFLTGNGPMFCAGGDPKSFQAASAMANEDNAKDAISMARFMRVLSSLPLMVCCLLNGSAMGGGVGLVSCCDYVIAKKSAFIALTEVKLGVIPATISPYVIAKIGTAKARWLFMTGQSLRADEAMKMGLVNELCDTAEDMRKAAEKLMKTMRTAAPQAVAAAKNLLLNIAGKEMGDELRDYTAGLERPCKGQEAIELMSALQARTRAPWHVLKFQMP
mmetsp:Transcript_28900/g.47941  ORF Transcript_28900/g.47941 Transcript_28900/m.47941 type:complete len:287 (+) Transcript_28900:104-964(+)|eukprot:CAMPEP_0119313196 /NCGR_PEP_ID=MMETSP1333-20130426/28192_1 /TAXON_ID=418940 /ORGANISM="Scyphosphaera apsteinii, Strain RCC1455" /LENGTH=286 /DNA_ID=CAMNT_0007317973 /DNA_START=101 /DNA_END=961 /DNA_ORIENTATION=-